MNRNNFATFESRKTADTSTDLMDTIRILWADDEIDLLKPHLLFLQEKGYDVTTTTNGGDAFEQFKKQQ